MEAVFEILKYILPAGVVFATAYYILKTFLDNERRKQMADMRKSQMKMSVPIRLQAYERLTLLLERISPDSLIMRVHQQGMNARTLQRELLKHIRQEYEHNISQQIYVSSNSWQLVKNAKEETIKLINLASSKVNDDASGVDLSKVIFDLATKVEQLPTHVALEHLKKEVRKHF